VISFGQAIHHNVDQQRVQGERFAQNEADIGELIGQFTSKSLQIVGDVRPGRKEIRQQEDAVGTLSNAGKPAIQDGRLGQLQVGNLDDWINRSGAQSVGETDKIEVGRIPATAVRNHQGCTFPVRCFFSGHPTPLLARDLTFTLDCGMIDGNRPAARENSNCPCLVKSLLKPTPRGLDLI
jgi:hypothetical protein